MRHKVIVGGFASSERQIKRVAEELSVYYDEDVDGFSLRQAMDSPVRLDQHLRGSTVITHSAGFEAIRHTTPSEIIGITPPLATPTWQLIARAAWSGIELLSKQSRRHELFDAVNSCIQENAKEFIEYPYGHLKHLRRISQCDAFDVALAASEAGIDTNIAFMNHDRLFPPNELKIFKARVMGLRAVVLSGGHEEFMLQPAGTMDEYHKAIEEFDQAVAS